MKKPKTIVVHENLFDIDFVLTFCEWKDLKERVGEFAEEPHKSILLRNIQEHGNKATALATQYPLEGGGSLIWISPRADTGTIVHELVHASHHALQARDTKLSEDTEEIYAYFLEFLYREFIGVK